MLSRWGNPEFQRKEDKEAKKRVSYKFRRLTVARSFSQFHEEFDLPSMVEIERARKSGGRGQMRISNMWRMRNTVEI
jgi:hypothetical protein